MTDKEILAELRRIYDYLVDIRDNASDTQLSDETKKTIFHIENEIADVYEEAYGKATSSMKVNDNFIIASDICFDYYDTKYEEYCSKEFNGEYEWWNDRDFLWKD